MAKDAPALPRRSLFVKTDPPFTALPRFAPKPEWVADGIPQIVRARGDAGLAVKAKLGRPCIEDRGKTNEATKPWLKLGMSRRTWYRRQAKELAVRKPHM